MLLAIISDIHSNREALEAVLARIDAQGITSLACLGDVVGYGADPDFCVERVLSRTADIVRGNHDKAVAGFLNLEWFNAAARAAALWTRSAVRPETLDRIRRLAEGPRRFTQDASILLSHGTPFDEDAYLIDSQAVEESFRFLAAEHAEVRVCFVGHTHVPLVAVRQGHASRPRALRWRETLHLERGGVYLINPGSVGQPRDGIAEASFGILDTDGMTYRNVRVPYPVSETQRKILQAGLPSSLAYRLGEGR